jgi:hypothetical protein
MNNNNNNPNNRRRFRGGDNNAGKIKSVSANRDKYLNLARDAMASGDRVEAENYLQHAEHYYRVLSFLQEEDARNRPERNENNTDAEAENADNTKTPSAESNREENAEDEKTDDKLAMAS